MIEPLQTTLPNRLFVYGTLMTTAAHPMGLLLHNNGHRIGNGTIRARLYIIDDPDEPGLNFYPGALPSGSAHDKVHGELYELTAPELVLEQFDDYEACSARWPEPYEFLRRTVDVSMQGRADPACHHLSLYMGCQHGPAHTVRALQ